MKTQFRPLYLLISMIASTMICAQTNPPDVKSNQFNPVGSGGSTTTTTSGSSYIYIDEYGLGQETGMYLSDDWIPGKIILKDQTEITGQLYRYNMYTCQMEFIDGVDTAAIGNPEDVDLVLIGDRKFVYAKDTPSDTHRTGYMEILVDGQNRLLKCRHISYQYVEDPDNVSPVEKYFLETRLFYSINGDSPVELPSQRREVVELFGDEHPGIKNYMKSEHNKLRSENDYISLFRYLNK